MNILILQKNTGKAGAQNSLRRLLMSEEFRKQNVVVVTGTEGWFVDQVKAQDIPVISVNFPSSRSIYGRIIGNSLWLYSVTKALKINATYVISEWQSAGQWPMLYPGIRK